MVGWLCLSAAAWRAPLPHPCSQRSAGRSAPPLLTHPSAADHPALSSVEQLVDQYDAFLLDQFGVIHDGKRAYPGAVDAVSLLQRSGKKVVIISNSSRRKGDTIKRLLSMGFGPCEAEGSGSGSGSIGSKQDEKVPISVVTSGDLVWQGLRDERARQPFEDLGIRCFVFGNGEDDEEYVHSCGKVPSPISQADFILARGLFSMLGAGPDLLTKPAIDYTPDREAAALQAAMMRRPGGLPLLVANPDEARSSSLPCRCVHLAGVGRVHLVMRR